MSIYLYLFVPIYEKPDTFVIISITGVIDSAVNKGLSYRRETVRRLCISL